MANILDNLDILKAVVYKAKLYGAYMLSTCHTLYDIRDQFRVNAFVIITSPHRLYLYSLNQIYNIAYVVIGFKFAIDIDKIDHHISLLNCKVYNRKRHYNIDTKSSNIVKDYAIIDIQSPDIIEAINNIKIIIKNTAYQFILFNSSDLQFCRSHFDAMKLRDISIDTTTTTRHFIVDVTRMTVHNQGSMLGYMNPHNKNIYVHESLFKQLPHVPESFKPFMSIDDLASLRYYLNTKPRLYQISLDSHLVKYITSHNHVIFAKVIRLTAYTKITHISSDIISCKQLKIMPSVACNISRVYCDKHIEYNSYGDVSFIFDGYNVFYDDECNNFLIVFGGRYVGDRKLDCHFAIDYHLNMDTIETDLLLLIERYIFITPCTTCRTTIIPKDDYYIGTTVMYRKVIESPHLIVRNKGVDMVYAIFSPIDERSPTIEIVDCGTIDTLIITIRSCLFKAHEDITIISKTYIRKIQIKYTGTSTLTYNMHPAVVTNPLECTMLWHSKTDPTAVSFERTDI